MSDMSMFFSILMETSKSKVNCTWPVPLIWEELCFYPWSVPLICEGMCFYPWTVPLIWEGMCFYQWTVPFICEELCSYPWTVPLICEVGMCYFWPVYYGICAGVSQQFSNLATLITLQSAAHCQKITLFHLIILNISYINCLLFKDAK